MQFSVPQVNSPTYSVLVTFEQVGFHCWPQAPKRSEYLRNDHRHLFKFKVELWVEGHDREIEVHDLKDYCQTWARVTFSAVVGDRTHDPRATISSCEKFAERLLVHLGRAFDPLRGRVECWEDGECGGAAECTFAPGEESTAPTALEGGRMK